MMGKKGPQSNGRMTQRAAARRPEGWSLLGPTHLELPGTHWGPICEARCFSILTTNHQAVGSLCLLYLLPFLEITMVISTLTPGACCEN